MGRYLDIARKFEARREQASEAPRPVSPPRPTCEEAVAWLRTKLISPRQIGPLIAEWVGPHLRDRLSAAAIGARIDTLMAARWALGVIAYLGEHDRFM